MKPGEWLVKSTAVYDETLDKELNVLEIIAFPVGQWGVRIHRRPESRKHVVDALRSLADLIDREGP